MKVSTRLLYLLPVAAMLSSCAQSINVQNEHMVAPVQTAVPVNFVVYPDDKPSIPDGAVVWKQMNCAQCHGEAGDRHGLNDPRAMARRKPVDMFKFLAFGDAKSNHPPLLKQRSVRDVWNLVVYTRSLGVKPLTAKEIEAIDPVFGANCAVCHGTKGDGDGPLARNLEPFPANFQTFRRFYDRDDDTLFDHIANGIKWEGMPNFLGKEDRAKNVKFDHAYIHKLVQYVRNFHISNEPTFIAQATDAKGEQQAEGARPGATTSGSTVAPRTPQAGTNGAGGAAGTSSSGEAGAPGAAGEARQNTTPSGTSAGQQSGTGTEY